MGSILMTCVVIAVVCAVIVVATLSLNKSSKMKDDIAIVISGLAATPIAIIVGLPLMWGVMTAVIKPVVHAMDSISSIGTKSSTSSSSKPVSDSERYAREFDEARKVWDDTTK